MEDMTTRSTEQKLFLVIQEVMNLGIMVEYLIKQLEEATGVKVNIDEFNEFAKTRFEEIRQEAQRLQTTSEGESIGPSAEELGLDLQE